MSEAVPQLLTQGEVCAALKCSRTTLWRICTRGRLAPVYLLEGGSPRFRLEDVRSLIENSQGDARKRNRSIG